MASMSKQMAILQATTLERKEDRIQKKKSKENEEIIEPKFVDEQESEPKYF